MNMMDMRIDWRKKRFSTGRNFWPTFWKEGLLGEESTRNKIDHICT
jgi:hypothetical protein